MLILSAGALRDTPAGKACADTGYIPADELGKPLRPHRYSAEFARLCREAGEPVSRRHDARHSLDSLLAKRGVPEHNVIQATGLRECGWIHFTFR